MARFIFFVSSLLAAVYVMLNLAFGTIYGAFLFSVSLYFLLDVFGSASPLSFLELTYWVDGLSVEMKSALLGSTVTVLGFLIAFKTSHQGFLKQQLIQLRLSVAEELEDLSRELHPLINELEIFAEYVVETKAVAVGGDADEAKWRIDRIQKQIPLIEAKRDRLNELSTRFPTIKARHSLVLSGVGGAESDLDRVEAALDEIAPASWFFVYRIPLDVVPEERHADAFMRATHFDECAQFVERVKKNRPILAGATGSLRGRLLIAITGINSRMVSKLFFKRKDFIEYVDEVNRFQKKSSR